MCHVSHVMCHMSRVTCHNVHVIFFFFLLFSGQSGEAYRWRVCYQRGLPRLVLIYSIHSHNMGSQNPSKRFYWYASVCDSMSVIPEYFKHLPTNCINFKVLKQLLWKIWTFLLNCVRYLCYARLDESTNILVSITSATCHRYRVI